MPHDRRHFLAASMATLFAAHRAHAAPLSITFGFSLYGMRSLSFEEALTTCQKNGYEAIELACMPDWPADPKKLSATARKDLQKQLSDRQLALPALMENWPLDGDAKRQETHLERLKLVAELAHALAPKNPPVLETILGGKPNEWDTVKAAFAERLGAWAKVAEQQHITIAIKAHRFGAVNRPEYVRWLLEQVKSKSLAAVYDWSHFEQRDMSLAETVKALARVTRFVHIKDTVVEKGQAKFVLPGAGQTDYAELLAELVKHQYTGCVCVEVSGMVFNQKEYDPRHAAEFCARKITPAFTKIRTGKTPSP